MEFSALKKRKELKRIMGTGEYLYFSSAFLSVILLSIFLSAAIFLLLSLPQSFLLRENIMGGAVESLLPSYEYGNENEFVLQFIKEVSYFLNRALGFFIALCFGVFIYIFLVCPIFMGTLRWCAFSVEEKSVLSLKAIMFYFLSPKLYFSCVLINLRIFIKKMLVLSAFLLPPLISLFLSSMLSSDFYGQSELAGASLILSVIWFILALVLFVIFIQKYSAVRYLYALGESKKLFVKSKTLTDEERLRFLILKLRLSLNLFFVLFVVTAPIGISRIISGFCLCINSLLKKRKKASAF